jgi:hypothetical protein
MLNLSNSTGQKSAENSGEENPGIRQSQQRRPKLSYYHFRNGLAVFFYQKLRAPTMFTLGLGKTFLPLSQASKKAKIKRFS